MPTCKPYPSRGAGRQYGVGGGGGALSGAPCMQATVGKGTRWGGRRAEGWGPSRCGTELRGAGVRRLPAARSAPRPPQRRPGGPLRDRQRMAPGPLPPQHGPALSARRPPTRRRRRPSPEQRAKGERQRPQPSLARRRAPTATNGSQRPLGRRRAPSAERRKPEGKVEAGSGSAYGLHFPPETASESPYRRDGSASGRNAFLKIQPYQNVSEGVELKIRANGLERLRAQLWRKDQK
ncbi:serine/arginine repetitive matrix protein 1-like [Grus americana]|uniref:serine/arginine repetitive matrix protein 1-like n=1 Tax=Grus americana TaxID=9117 RepID=UPI002407E05C|nr:serine/arginine repetitive matrix protein 1-like [Grus americana]